MRVTSNANREVAGSNPVSLLVDCSSTGRALKSLSSFVLLFIIKSIKRVA